MTEMSDAACGFAGQSARYFDMRWSAKPQAAEPLRRLRVRGRLPTLGVFRRLEDQFEHSATFFHGVDRSLPGDQTIREVADLGFEGVDGVKLALGRLLRAARQVIKCVLRAEDLSALADHVDLVGAVRVGEGPAREDLADRAVFEADADGGGVFAFDRLDEATKRSTNLDGATAGEIEQPVGRVVAGVDQLPAALRLQIGAPRAGEGARTRAAGAEAVLAAQPQDAADLAGVDHALRFLYDGHEQLIVRGHVRHARPFDGVADPVGLVEARAHRLLAEDVLPGGGGVDDRRAVQVVRQADVDGVDVALHLPEALLPVGERARRHAGRSELLGALLQVLLRHVNERDAPDLVAVRKKTLPVGGRDPARADDRDAHRRLHSSRHE